MNFLHAEHQKEYFNFINQLDSNLSNKKEFKALAYLITGNKELQSIFIKEKLMENGILQGLQKLLECNLSSNLNVLVTLALSIVNEKAEVKFSDVFSKLEKPDIQLAINAGYLRYHQEDNLYETDVKNHSIIY